jgi:hypothetical protein
MRAPLLSGFVFSCSLSLSLSLYVIMRCVCMCVGTCALPFSLCCVSLLIDLSLVNVTPILAPITIGDCIVREWIRQNGGFFVALTASSPYSHASRRTFRHQACA